MDVDNKEDLTALRVLWIVVEGKEVPALDEQTRAIFLDLICVALFWRTEELSYAPPIEGITYFCSLSYKSVSMIVDACANYCEDYDWHMIFLYVMQWVLADGTNWPSKMEIFKRFCYQKFDFEPLGHFWEMQSRNKVINYMAEVQQVQQSDNGYNVSPMMPFTISSPDGSSYTHDLPPIDDSDLPPSSVEGPLKAFVFGIGMLTNWIKAIKASKKGKVCPPHHKCRGFDCSDPPSFYPKTKKIKMADLF